MNVILIGATGATGAALLQHLLQDEKITSVTTLVRRPLDISHTNFLAYLCWYGQPYVKHILFQDKRRTRRSYQSISI